MSSNNNDKDESVPHNRSVRYEANNARDPSFLAVPEDCKQVDFFKNPTVLSRLVLNRKYASAIKRLRGHPEEASVWVCMKRNPFKREACMKQLRRNKSIRHSYASMEGGIRSNSRYSSSSSLSSRSLHSQKYHHRAQVMMEYTMRQLPIHTACSNLLRSSHDPTERQELEKLITHLIVTYSEGCEQADHEGKLPLHEAIWNNASLSTISMLLMASPSTLHERDRLGRSPLDLNRVRSGRDKERVKDLLLRGVCFWEQAQAEALARMNPPPQQKASGEVGKAEEAKDDRNGASVLSPSLSVGAAAGDYKPLVRELSMQLKYSTAENKPSGQPQDDECSVVEPITWIKLERRAIHLEQLLAGMYEENYYLGEMVEELSRERVELQAELETCQKRLATGSAHFQDSATLLEENEHLKEQIAHMDRFMQDEKQQGSHISPIVVARSDSGDGSLDDTLEEFKEERRDSIFIDYLQDRNATLEGHVEEMSEKIEEYELKMNRLEVVVAGLRKSHPAESSEVAASHVLNSISEDGSSPRAMPTKEDAKDDLDSLIDTLSTKSRFATERFLAGKVQLLEERLNGEMRAREADVLRSAEENGRLLRENEALQRQVNKLSRTEIPYETGVQKRHSDDSSKNTAGSSSRESQDDPARFFGSDDLDEILRGAAAMYSSSTSIPSEPSSRSGESDEFDNLLNEASRIFSPSVSSEKRSRCRRQPAIPLDPTVELDDSPDEVFFNEMDRIRSEVARIERIYGKPIPTELRFALETSVNSFLSDLTPDHIDEEEDLEKVLGEAAILYGQPIPSGLKSAMRGISLLEPSAAREISGSTPALPDADVDLGLVHESAANAHGSIPSKGSTPSGANVSSNKKADVGTAPDSKSELVSDNDQDKVIQQIESSSEPEDDLEHILGQAASGALDKTASTSTDNRLKASGPSSSSRTTLVRKKLVPSAAQPYLPPQFSSSPKRKAVVIKPEPYNIDDTSRRPPMAGKAHEQKTVPASLLPEKVPSDGNDELESIIREAERAYGRELPSDFKQALRTVSLDSVSYSDDDDLESIIREAERAYGRAVPPGLKLALRKASIATKESVPPSTDVDIESIIREAERVYGSELPSDLKVVLREASVSPQKSMSNCDDDLETIIREAEIAYGSDLPADLKLALRQTSVSSGISFETYDLLRGTSGIYGPIPSEMASAVMKGASAATQQQEIDDLESIFDRAEKMMGRRLPSDLKLAVRSASLSSNLSFNTDDLIEDSSTFDGMPIPADARYEMFRESAVTYSEPIMPEDSSSRRTAEFGSDDLNEILSEAQKMYSPGGGTQVLPRKKNHSNRQSNHSSRYGQTTTDSESVLSAGSDDIDDLLEAAAAAEPYKRKPTT